MFLIQLPSATPLSHAKACATGDCDTNVTSSRSLSIFVTIGQLKWLTAPFCENMKKTLVLAITLSEMQSFISRGKPHWTRFKHRNKSLYWTLWGHIWSFIILPIHVIKINFGNDSVKTLFIITQQTHRKSYSTTSELLSSWKIAKNHSPCP